MKSFRESGKQHLLITGSKKSGKTTLLCEILKDTPSYGGIITYVIRDEKHTPKYVVLQDINKPEINGLIAQRNKAGTSLFPITDTFDKLGVRILNEYNCNGVDLIVIDEIGFLESQATFYQKELLRCFDKRVIAIIRKELNRYTESLVQKQDVFLVDIDDITPLY